MVDKNRSLVEMYRYSVIVFNNIIVPLVLVGHKMIEANLHVRESLVISYLTSAKEITVDLERTHFSREWEY